MKTLIVMRHGKSSWEVDHLDDIRRPLLAVGKERNARSLAYLIANNIQPELIITSPAERTIETAKFLISESYWENVKLVEEKNLYFEGIEGYENAVYALPDDVSSAMIVGHNPMLTDFVNRFIKNKIENFPTSALFAMKLDTNQWTDLYQCSIEELFIFRPKKM